MALGNRLVVVNRVFFKVDRGRRLLLVHRSWHMLHWVEAAEVLTHRFRVCSVLLVARLCTVKVVLRSLASVERISFKRHLLLPLVAAVKARRSLVVERRLLVLLIKSVDLQLAEVLLDKLGRVKRKLLVLRVLGRVHDYGFDRDTLARRVLVQLRLAVVVEQVFNEALLDAALVEQVLLVVLEGLRDVGDDRSVLLVVAAGVNIIRNGRVAERVVAGAFEKVGARVPAPGFVVAVEVLSVEREKWDLLGQVNRKVLTRSVGM